MRILHVTRELGGDRRYGIGRAIAPVVDALKARGHAVEYLTQDAFTDGDRGDQARWIARSRQALRPWFGAPGEVVGQVLGERLHMGAVAARRARQLQAQVVHLHDPWLGLGFALAARLRGGPRVPWGVTQHGFGSYTEAIREEGVPTTTTLLRWQRRLEARVLSAAPFVAAPTAAARAQLQRDMAWPLMPPQWHVLPHARPPGGTAASDAPPRASLGLPTDRPVLLAVGRLNPVKRMDAVVHAAVALALERPMHLEILGEGDVAPLQAIAAMAPQGCLSLRVQVVADVSPYLRACDVYVSASRNESFGLANLEALACGAAAVCTAVGGVPEVTGGAAWLVPGSDEGLADRLADAVGHLLSAPDQKAWWSDRGRRHAAHWPGPQEVASAHEALYHSLA